MRTEVDPHTALVAASSTRSTKSLKWLILQAVLCLFACMTFYGQAPVAISVTGNISGSGTMTLWVDSYSKAVRYGPFSSAASLASAFGGTISLDVNAPVWAKGYPDGTLKMSLRSSGTVSNVHIDVVPDGGTSSPPIAISTNPGGIQNGNPASGTAVYSYSITKASDQSSGYDPAGNIVAFTDSVNGQWTAGYDDMNRLVAGFQSSTTRQFQSPWGNAMQQYLCWKYDSFGNRLQASSSSSAFVDQPSCSGNGGAITSASTLSIDTQNRVTNMNYTYDAGGNLTGDGIYSYQYDGAGRLCAVQKNVTGAMTGYLFDAEGRRVAKGTIQPTTSDWCDLATNRFTVTSHSVLDPDGTVLTEFDDAAGTSSSNFPLTSGVGVTLTSNMNSAAETHFRLQDWVGTKRMQTDALGVAEQSCESGPFGEFLNCSGLEASREHFTGKERDTESGLDYFGARYYSSNAGRWMTPDWSVNPISIPFARLDNPQTLNLYGYVGNNPLRYRDAFGHSTDCNHEGDKSLVCLTTSLWDKIKNFFSGSGGSNSNASGTTTTADTGSAPIFKVTSTILPPSPLTNSPSFYSAGAQLGFASGSISYVPQTKNFIFGPGGAAPPSPGVMLMAGYSRKPEDFLRGSSVQGCAAYGLASCYGVSTSLQGRTVQLGEPGLQLGIGTPTVGGSFGYGLDWNSYTQGLYESIPENPMATIPGPSGLNLEDPRMGLDPNP